MESPTAQTEKPKDGSVVIHITADRKMPRIAVFIDILSFKIHNVVSSTRQFSFEISAKPSAMTKPFDFAGMMVSVAPGARSNSPSLIHCPVDCA